MRCGGVGLGVRALVVLGTLVVAATARAQGTIADGPATFVIGAGHFDTSPSANLTGVSVTGTQDHLFEEGWWYRIAGDSAETFFPVPDLQSYLGDTATLTWNDVNARGFGAVETDTVVDGGGPSGQVILSLTLTNLSPTTPLTIDVFHMADLDLAATAGSDTATLGNPNDLILMADGGVTAQYTAVGAASLLVRPFGATDLGAVLGDAAVTDLDNSGLPFGPGDVTAGFQWTAVVIPPSGSRTFTAVIAVNMVAIPPTTTSTSTSSTTSTSSSSTSSTSTSSTTLPPLPREACDNCLDDDGDGLVDLEDAECCTADGAAAMVLTAGALKPRTDGRVNVRIAASFGAMGLAGDPPVQDLALQIRSDDTGEVACAWIPASSMRHRRAKTIFRDRAHGVARARGLDNLTMVEKASGGKISARGKMVVLPMPGPGPLTVTFGLRDPATAEATNWCASATGEFRARRKGISLQP